MLIDLLKKRIVLEKGLFQFLLELFFNPFVFLTLVLFLFYLDGKIIDFGLYGGEFDDLCL